MTANQFRTLALSLDGAVERAHMNHPDFRANGKIFATLSGDGTKGMVALTPEQQRDVLREHGAMFSPASGAWGRQGCTMVTLAAADSESVGEALTLAWQKAQKAAPGKTKKKAARRR